MAEGLEAGGVSRERGLLQANCLNLINQSYWTIQMKTNGLGRLLQLPHMQQCAGSSDAFWGLQLENRGISTDGWSACAPILSVYGLGQLWSSNRVDLLIPFPGKPGKWFFHVLIKLGQIRKKCMKCRIKTSCPDELIRRCIIHTADIFVTQMYHPHGD